MELLHLSWKKIDESVLKAVIDVGDLVQRFQDSSRELMETVLDRAQLIANILPFSSKIPHMNNVSPLFLPPTSLNFSVVTLSGNFPLIGKYPPVLVLGSSNISCPIVAGSTSIASASFIVSNDVLHSVDTSLTFGIVTGAAIFPNPEGFIIHHLVNFTYRLMFSILPYSPGSGVVYFASHPQVGTYVLLFFFFLQGLVLMCFIF